MCFRYACPCVTSEAFNIQSVQSNDKQEINRHLPTNVLQVDHLAVLHQRLHVLVKCHIRILRVDEDIGLQARNL